MLVNESFMDQLILNQRRAIHYYLFFAVGLGFLGIMVIFVVFLFRDKLPSEIIKTILTLGGPFISSLSVFPIKEILNRKEKVGIFEIVKTHLHDLGSLDTSERTRIENLLWQAVEKTALG